MVLSDLRADDAVLKGDQLVFEARVTARGPDAPASVPVVLSERRGDKLVELARETVRPDPAGKPVPVRLVHTPAEAGERTYVIEVPAQPGEADADNNRLERVVLVSDARKLRVLYVEGYPRYEFRFVKALLERETDAVAGNKSVELQTLLLDASPGYAEQDKSARRALPTRAELMAFDAVIVGDVDPGLLPKANAFFSDLGEFVRVRGGGLLCLAGGRANPHLLFPTPLADLLPVLPADGAAPGPDAAGMGEGFRPKLTPFGRGHPLFRLAADEADNTRAWADLRPLQWFSPGLKRKQSAEVLAVHPDRPAEGGPGEQYPLAVQQFVGAGRVIFLGFDETWRWRYRQGEERFNQFWVGAVRFLARSRVSRPEVRTDKQTAYRRDEPIRLTVRFPDDAPAPAADVPVRVGVERVPLRLPGGAVAGPPADALAVQLAKVEGSRATYQALLTRTPEGEYKFTLGEPAGSGGSARAEAKVLPPPGEKERLDMDRAALAGAAGASRGKFYTLADADEVVDDLPEAARVPLSQPVPPVPVWDHAALFGLLLTALGAEWWLRRRERLV